MIIAEEKSTPLHPFPSQNNDFAFLPELLCGVIDAEQQPVAGLQCSVNGPTYQQIAQARCGALS